MTYMWRAGQAGPVTPKRGNTIIANQALQVSGTNARYLTQKNGNGSAVLLLGVNYWNALQDGGRTNPPPAFDFDTFVTFLTTRGLNYTKAHVWEQASHQSAASTWYTQPTIYARTGPGNALDGDLKFDVTQFNATYFNRLRSRCIQYGANGIYVAICIFDRFSVHNGNTMSDQWLGHPYHTSNNINSINGDPNSNGHGLDVETLYISAITTKQEAYIAHLVDTLNDLDNIVWEIAMEPDGTYTSAGSDTPAAWVDHMIAYVKTYELGKAKQHPVLQGVFSPGGSNSYLFGSGAHVVSPNAGTGEYDHDCAYQTGSKVLLMDTDHILWTEQATEEWSWKTFLRGGGGFTIMDGGYSTYDDQGGGADFAGTENSRYVLGDILDYSQAVDLINSVPQNGGTSPCSTGYCLYKAGSFYFCLSTAGGASFTLDLTGQSGTFTVEWYRLPTRAKTSGGTVAGNGNRTLTPPAAVQFAAYVHL